MKLPSLLLAGALGSAAFAENWPQWRGPNFNGSANISGLPATFTKADAKWVTPLPGHAGSTPVVWGDRIFLTTPDEAKNLNLVCLDAKTGVIKWSKTVAVGDKEKGRNNMASPSPVTDGKRVIALFGTGDLAAFDFEGNELWRRPLHQDYGRFAIMWIYGASPLLTDGQLIIPFLQRDEMPNDYPLFDGKPERDSFLLSLDPATGKTLWKAARETDSTKESHESYATPFPYRGANGNEIVVVGGDHVSGHNPKDGSELWRARLYSKRDDWYRIVTSPVALDGLIYASGPKGQPVVAFKDGGKGDVTATHKVWEFTEAPTDWSTPLVYKGKLFVLDGGKRILSRLDPKTGTKEWSGKLETMDQIWSSPTGADGKIYLLSENGTVLVVSAGDSFEILNRLELDEGPARSSVVPFDRGILVRTGKNLYCFAKK
ncbi:MAG TPA: PQQ-binding-like beta-propeller repeat protein [Verrucomicrobiota bacterium]|nr:PQQ-binding-like beta-propeller repeat protein [Verrucomicrobiota bacterium]